MHTRPSSTARQKRNSTFQYVVCHHTLLQKLFLMPLFIFFFLLFLTGCAITVHRDLTHRDFSTQYPNWKDYQLEKYEDSTFRVITLNKKETCRVQVASYATDYLTVAKILLETIQQTPTFTLLNKSIKYKQASIDYASEQSDAERVTISVNQCGDFTYVMQYACLDKVYDKYLQSIKTMKNSIRCVAPVVYDY